MGNVTNGRYREIQIPRSTFNNDVGKNVEPQAWKYKYKDVFWPVIELIWPL